ncbi:MAG: phytoene desaturase [Limimaricola sp.]|uniref:1-hydroxycarotenoid 3,4-desaturase CrtD n=1 Tax=Limimaricola sp. TaxID=2211665 RepID=UPI001DF8939F|nr:1-hydroxycarotenoid 3,4-desaturase CrtD [Limimaricola sp.]MBI1417125.1 phytoene desaturase [Limimaricola sp.]
MKPAPPRIVVIGAGIGGLAAALRLSHAGCAVTVLEAQAAPGGKMRTVQSAAGPVDAGPTVLTLRPVFEALFADVGIRLEDHLTLLPLSVLARHFWDDGAQLDLCADAEQSAANVAAAFGNRAAAEFTAFSARAARLFAAFDAPMMQAAEPSQAALARLVARSPALLRDMAPWASLAGLLRSNFRDPHLRQLFGRYATYVGGAPGQSPALLSLIWQAEAAGVWAVQGGMHRLAAVLADLAAERGAVFHYATPARHIERQSGKVAAVATDRGRFAADVVLFNGDPRALAEGLLGEGVRGAVMPSAITPRSLSAWVHAFAATPSGPELAYHTVFFGHEPQAEFTDLARGAMPADPTLYICAQDRAAGRPNGTERFEIIMNGAPGPGGTEKEIAACQTLVFSRLRQFGLHFDPLPGPEMLTTPAHFGALFPASLGSLYGRSPHGLTAGMKRPTARTTVPGLYLCGGGAHPGAGVPMATLSARHAAAAILTDLASTLPHRPAATTGGTSTGSAPTGAAPSRSSAS